MKNINESIFSLATEQAEFQKIGYDTAIENGGLVTIGGVDSDYFDWTEFMITQIVETGSKKFCQELGWKEDDLIDALIEFEELDWRDLALDEFNGMEAA